ncbi:MAG TPA: FtsX-like permease family protein [Acidimicrobiales bacterium]|nr:FtsX-like permease family protein [Acidimicrobiales bacterium]
MIRLAGRLTAGGGREAVVRLVLTGVGMALAVAMLLFAAVGFPALHAHDVRRGWLETSADNDRPAQDESATDPLLWRLATGRFEGHDLVRVDVAAEGPDAPLPPGLERLPGPGEIAVSPRLDELLDATDPAQLADRFPGRITATVGRDALASPDDLVAFVGHAPAELQDETGVVTVRSIESAPASRAVTQEMRVVLAVGGVGLLVPVVVFVATATRLAAARREQRLAALRLAGATHRQVGVVAGVEAAAAAAGGTVVGFVGFLALRPSVARVPFDGASFYPSDLRLSPAWAVLVALGVPLLAVGAAIVSLRRVRISPLGVARRSVPSRPKAWPLLLVAAGMAFLALVVVWSGRSNAEDAESYAVGLAFLVLIVGIALSGPWLTALAARGIARFGRRAPSLLAARRLQDDPAAGFRAISGLTLAVFVGTVFSGIAASVLADEHVDAADLAPGVVAAAPHAARPEPPPTGPDAGPAPPAVPRRPELDAARTTQLVRDLARTDGVERVVVARAFPDDLDLLTALVRSGADIGAPVLVSCTDAEALGFEPCAGTTVVEMTGQHVEPTGFVAPIPGDALEDLPPVAVAAATDGQVATIEAVRTRLELGVPGAQPITQRDIDAESRSQLDTMQRVSNIGLSVTLVIAGCSLAVAVAGAIVERKQPFALLRLAGTRLSDLHRVVLAEAAAPLLMMAGASVGLGLVVAALVMAAGSGGDQTFVLPGLDYWLSLVGGLAVALLVVLATLPLLDRLTALDATRFE